MTAAHEFASYDDLLTRPENGRGEIVHGRLGAQPRPRLWRARATAALGVEDGSAFDLGDDRPGACSTRDAPEPHPDADARTPDLRVCRLPPRRSRGGDTVDAPPFPPLALDSAALWVD